MKAPFIWVPGGAASAAGTLRGSSTGGPVVGLMGMVDATLTGGSFGAIGRGLGGVLGDQAAVPARQLALYAFVIFDVGL